MRDERERDSQKSNQGRQKRSSQGQRQKPMTPEERRRLQLLRRQRQRKKRRALIRRCLLVAVILTLIVVVVPKGLHWGYDTAISLTQKISTLWSDEEQNDSIQAGGASVQSGDPGKNQQLGPTFSFGSVDPEIMALLQARYEKEDTAQDILAHPGQYPDDLLTLLSKRPETLEFVLAYPEKKEETHPEVDLSGEIKKGVIPRLYQWDLRWGYGQYGDNIIALAGCGPTCLSMVMLGLTGDAQWDPVRVAQFSEEQGYVSEVGTAWDLMTVGAKTLGLVGQELPLDESRMIRELEAGHPIICSMRPGDFTDTGHFIVLVEYKKGGFVVHDPNSIGNSDKIWNYEEIRGQIRNLWAFSVES